jgi:hypothetical protein
MQMRQGVDATQSGELFPVNESTNTVLALKKKRTKTTRLDAAKAG